MRDRRHQAEVVAPLGRQPLQGVHRRPHQEARIEQRRTFARREDHLVEQHEVQVEEEAPLPHRAGERIEGEEREIAQEGA